MSRWVLLIGMAVLLGGPAIAGDDELHDYVGFKKCGTCHKKDAIGNQVAAWRESKHAKAYETLASDQALEYAKKAGISDPQTADECLKCHVTAFGVAESRLGMKFDRKAGVQCEACHGPGKDYRKKKIMKDRDKAVAKGLILQSEEVCTTCHNDESPAWDPERYTLADGTKTGFDYDQAVEEIAHPVPEDYDPEAEGEAD
jgi:hypothetical protein